MSYIQFKVRSGGIYIKQKKDFQPIELNFKPHPQDKKQKVLALVQESSIKGLFSYLMGETQKIKKIENNTDISIQKLNATLDMMVQVAAYQKISEPHITTFFERKDTHRKRSEFADNPSVNLSFYSFTEADSTVKLLKAPLNIMFETDNLGKINKSIQDSKIKSKNSRYHDLNVPDDEYIPNTNLGQKMKAYFNKMKTAQKPIYQKTLDLITETNKLCLKDENFKKQLEQAISAKFSVFEMPQKTKHWVDTECHSVVRGTPAFIACVDFNIYLSESAFKDQRDPSKHWAWDEIFTKFRQGPNLGRWGEGGVVFVNYEGLDEMGRGYEEKDDMFVEISSLRKARMKTKNMIGKVTMNQKQRNNEELLLANTKKQPLKKHSIAVALCGHLLVKDLKLKTEIEKKINKYLIYSGLLHDIGKVSNGFQKYIDLKSSDDDLKNVPTDAEISRPQNFKGPFHNEISWAYITHFIQFNNRETKEIVRHSVYWHHPANWCDKKGKLQFENAKAIFDKINEQDIKKQIYEFTKLLFSSFSSYSSDLEFNVQHELKEPNDDIEEISCPKFFEHKINEVKNNAYKQLCLNLLLEADRRISSWSLDRLNSFLKDWKNFKIDMEKDKKFPLEEDLKNNGKSKEQNDLAKKMSSKKLSVCGIDPAGGKTSITLYWWHHCHNEYPLMIALPRQHQVTGLFDSIKKDAQRIYGNQKIDIEGVFNGQRQHDNWQPKEKDDLLISDINIMVFDRFLSPYYKRSQFSEFIKMLRSHLVLDEFHEFKDIPKMIPSLREILTIRCWLDSGVKTLMLSGTPEPSLLKLIQIENSFVFKRDELSSRDNHKFQISSQEKEIEEVKKFVPDCLYSFLRVDSCQEVFSQFFKNKSYTDQIKMIHTYFTTKDKKELLENILEDHGHGQKDYCISQKSVITAKMLQSSYNLSFNKALVELSQPYTDCQTAGRVNRFENKPDSKIHFIYNEESEKFFHPRNADFQKIHQNWKEHILSFIQKHGDKLISIRQLMESYDDFWNEENIQISLKILKKQQKEAIEELNKYIPKRFSFNKNKISSSQVFNSLFRGESRLLSACVVNDKGEPLSQLYNEDLLNESRSWLIQNILNVMNTCLRTNSASKKANKVKGEEVFEYGKYIKAFGFKVERPLLCSHFNQEVNECLNRNLLDGDTQKTEHRVYNKRFGLVKKEVLIKR